MIYNNRPALDVWPNFEEIEHGMLDDFTYESQGVGAATPWKSTTAPRRIISYPFLLGSTAEMKYFRGFLQALKGALKGFWMPLYIGDTRIVTDVALGGTLITVEKTGLNAAVAAYAQFQYIAFVTMKTIYAYKISSVALAGNSEIITLTSGLLKAIVASETVCAGFVYVRLAEHDVEYVYESENVCTVRLTMIELPKEYVTPHLGTRPIWLYRFTRGSTVWRFANWGTSITAGAVAWTPQDITHGDLTQSNEFLSDTVTIDMATDDSSHPFRYYTEAKAGEPTTVEIFKTDADTLTVDLNAPVYIGKAASVSFDDEGKMSVEVSSLMRIAEREVPRVQIQRLDNHQLYDEFCGLTRATYTTTGNLTVVDGEYVEANEFETKINATGLNSWFALGRITVGTEVRLILASNVGGNKKRLKLNAPFKGAVVGSPSSATAGCDKRIKTCNSKFGNLANNLSWPYIPNKHPQLKELVTPVPEGGKGNKV